MQQAINLDPKRSQSYLLLALLELRSNKTEEAEVSFKKAIQTDPNAMNAQMGLGGFYQSHNRLAEAEQQFRHAIDVDPKNSAAPGAALVRLLMQQGKRDEAEAFLKQTKKDLADNSDGYRMLGDFYFAVGDVDKAAAEYEWLHSHHPRDPVVKKNYIQILILKNQLDEAAKFNKELLKSTPQDVEALL